MLSNLRLLASRLLVLAIYIGLAVVGIALLVWGFVFALAVTGGLLLLFILMRIFGFRRPGPTVKQPGQPGPSGPSSSSAEAPTGVIELKRRDDGSYE
ncbi:hypothetical protein HPT27_12450 [Permianibacter sp. IMCC34836]|uniref:hypothetical protein n=1 Tax=Permianibacter fluminis TaxID=2738515 RepID=UPI0015567D9F|nr:hypothetical protein [Permianibacter fluminis]NQD37839.1 hypothetical protein [Permianibacter fluminis]